VGRDYQKRLSGKEEDKMIIIITVILVAGWCLYKYYRWASFMDQINADHFEFQKQGLWVEGVSYLVAEDETKGERE
jgi:hypothetical protein